MRAIFFSVLFLLSTGGLSAQSIFDTASCGGLNSLKDFTGGQIFSKSKEWVTGNIKPINYSENETAGEIRVTAFEDYNARSGDNLPQHYSGKFEYTLLIKTKDGYYSYDFINVRYIPKDEVKDALENHEVSNRKPMRVKKKAWDKISKTAFKQLQEKGKNYDAFMQKC